MIHVSSYVGWGMKHLDLWGSVSLGTGEVEIDNGATLLQESSDIEMRTIAAGVSGKVLETEAGSIVRLKGDALQTEIEVDGNGAELPADTMDANRLRVARAGLPADGPGQRYVAGTVVGGRYPQ